MKVFYKVIVLFLMGLDRHAQSICKFAISFDILRKVRNEFRYLTAQAGSNTALTVHYTSSVLLPLTLFFLNMESMPSLFFI